MMSEIEEQPQPVEEYGGMMASMFGFVTDEDRQKWNNQRQADANRKEKSKKGSSKSMNNMYQTLQRKQGAMERVVTQADFEQANVKATQMHYNAETQKLEETVEWKPTVSDQTQELHSDFDLTAGPEL